MLDQDQLAVPAHDIVVHRFVQGGEDAVDQDRVDRHRRPIGKMAVQHQPRHRADPGQHAGNPQQAGPGEFSRERLGDAAALLFEGPRGFQADGDVLGEQRAGRAVGRDAQYLFVEIGGRRLRLNRLGCTTFDDPHARGHGPVSANPLKNMVNILLPGGQGGRIGRKGRRLGIEHLSHWPRYIFFELNRRMGRAEAVNQFLRPEFGLGKGLRRPPRPQPG